MQRFRMVRRAGITLAAAGLAFGASVAIGRPLPRAAPPAASANLPERIIEKQDGDYVLRLTLRPGNLSTNRVANASVEIFKNLDIPDPVTGSTMPLPDSHPVATVTTPEGAPVRGRHAAEPTSTRYLLWGDSDEPGTFAFHFTPAEDGVYAVSISGTDAAPSGGDSEPHTFSATYRIGAGTAAAETEQSQSGTAGRRATRHPVGGDLSVDKHKQLAKLMTEIGYRYLDLDGLLNRAPARGGAPDAAAEAHALAALFSQIKGLAPHGTSDEFNSLASDTGHSFEALAATVAGRDLKAARRASDTLPSVGCDECHAKYRFDVTDDLSSWPKFAQKAVEQ